MAEPVIDQAPADELTPEWLEYIAFRDAAEATRRHHTMDDRPYWHVPYDHHKEWSR